MGDYRYRAFISYSHADEQAGAWLQRSLEQFRAPRELALRLAEAGKPVRLAPVFRDREDLPVAGNLNDAIQKALAESEFQIVLCSPNAAKSRWVNEEIKLFHRLHGPGRTFALLLAGEPNAGGDEECFPQALRFALNRDGEPTEAPAEPLAADAREGGDGKRYALLKTAAGMLGVGLDDLVRRDAQRRARAARRVALSASAIAGGMVLVTLYAVRQRDEAQTMRAKAETLVEFMLSDLSDRLEPVGKLDILQAVGGEVLDYYADQDLKSLDPAALSRRAQALMKLGQVDERRGDLDAALRAYEAAFASTEEQLRRAPSDPDRVFDHAQSVFYVGNVALIRGDYKEGEARFQQYFDMAQTLVEFDKVNPRWRLEVSYSANNLGALAFNRANYAASIPFFEKAVETRRELAAERPNDRKFKLAYASALSWLAYAQIAVGDNGNALEQLKKEIAIYASFDANASSEDFLALEKRITAERRVSVAQLSLGNVLEANSALDRAEQIGELLVGREPDNLLAINNIAITQRLQSNLSELSGDRRSALTEAERALSVARAVAKRDQIQVAFKANLGYALAQRIIIEPESAAAALDELDGLLRDPSIGSTGNDPEFRVRAGLARAVHARSIGRAEDAKRLATQTISQMEIKSFQLTAEARRAFALLLAESGDRDGASHICDELLAKGIRHPELLALQKSLENEPLTSRP